MYLKKSSVMANRYSTIGYVLSFLAFVAFLLGWKFLVAPKSPEFLADYQRRIEITAANISTPATDDSDASSLKIYSVNVVHTPPFKDPLIGYGVYFGRGIVLTAAHVVGRWPFSAKPHVLIAGQDLPAMVIKQGSPDETDLALLSVDQERLPVSLRLRRNPQCKGPLQVGTNVVVVFPERTVRSQIISPLLIALQYRTKFSTLITEPQGSGSGLEC